MSKARGKGQVNEGYKDQPADVLKRERIKNLQRKKDAPKVDHFTEEFIVDVLYGNKWESDHLDRVSQDQRNLYLRFLQSAVNILGFEDRDRFIDKIEKALTKGTKNNIWQFEHVDIINALDKLSREKNRLAARIEISDKTCLSQEAIERHIGEYFQGHHCVQRQQEFLLMRERLLSRCYKFAIDGDMKAARLFFEATSDKRPETSIQNQQNNFFQLNNLTITEEQINKLPEDKREQMKEILFMLREKAI